MARSPESLEALRRHHAAMRMVRWLAVAFVLVQFSLYQPPPGVALPFARAPVGITLAAVLATVSVITNMLDRRLSKRSLQVLGVAEWVFDGLVVMGLVWLFAFDQLSALWALLLLPIMEGALRYQLRGALAGWVAMGVGYIARDAWAATQFSYVRFELESITYRLGVLLLVAITVGMLSRDLYRQVLSHAAVSAAATRRAELLAVVAAAGPHLASQAEDTLAGVADAVMQLGFHACEVCVLDEGHTTYRIAEKRGPRGNAPDSLPAGTGAAGHAMRTGKTIVVDDYSTWPHAVPALASEGFRSVVAAPVFAGGAVVGALAAGFRDQRAATTDEIDGLQLLAAHVGAALQDQKRRSERDGYEQQLSHQAQHDSLTGMANRAQFTQRLEEGVVHARWEGAEVAVLCLDLDRFKNLNDTLGHAAGDALLRAVSDRIRRHIRSGDAVARLGGDEFTVLLEGSDVRGRAPRLARRLAQALREPFVLNGQRIYSSVSIGIAFGPVAGADGAELLRRADLAMYQAKELGRNRIAAYRPEFADRLQRSLDTETGLRTALENNEFVLHYQPMFDLRTGTLRGVEALVRWKKDGVLMPPAEFLCSAEETGLIVPLGRWVLNEAVQQHKRWRIAHPNPPAMFVNVSAQQLREAFFVGDVEHAITESGITPDQLVLEVTESGIMRDDEGIACLMRLRQLGVRLALDDFGTGWSSLSRLRGLPVDILKVDGSFVAQLPHDPRSTAIVRNVVALSTELNMEVTAEGIETETQRQAVKTLGCALGQGFLLARPQEATAIDALLAEQTLLGPRIKSAV